MLDYASLEDAHGTAFKVSAPVPMTSVVASTVPTLPLDPRADLIPAPAQKPVSATVQLPESVPDDKLSKILRLVEQNKTGYERASSQDLLLYILTGVVFLFTFDTFVSLGKHMGS